MLWDVTFYVSFYYRVSIYVIIFPNNTGFFTDCLLWFFLQALSAADLNLVLYVCETIDSQQVFGQQPCPLHQAVLLSLIQQLSTNLSTRTELKIRFVPFDSIS